MSFKKPLPTWKAQGIQPPEHKLEEGWKAQDKPPAGWLNWQANTTYEALQELQDNAVDHRDVTSEPSANGVVRLNEAGKLNEAVLAGAEHKEISLKPGVQIVESDQDTPFNVGSIKGRTLVNILGRKGYFESTQGWFLYAGTGSVSSNVYKITGNGTANNPQIHTNKLGSTPSLGDVFMIRAKVKNLVGNCDNISAYLFHDNTGLSATAYVGNPVVGEWNEITVAFEITQPFISNWDVMGLHIASTYADEASANNAVTEIKDVAFYKIPVSDKNLPTNDLLDKYPFVSSLTNVTNPYAIATGDNLLPPFYEWEILNSSISKISVRENYGVMVSNSDSSSAAGVRFYVKIIGGESYVLNASPIEGDVDGGEVYAYGCDASKNRLTGKLTGSFSADSNTEYVEVVCNSTKNGSAVVGTFIFRNPMLTVGTETKPYKPQQRSMWAAECQLAANPVDGSDADVLFTGDDGLPYVMEKWKKVTLDESLSWNYSWTQSNSYKMVKTKIQGITTNLYISKYNGSMVSYYGGAAYSSGDQFFIDISNGTLEISVSNSDSGWGDAYTPTADEIKAYFLGWRMMNADDWSTPYNNVGTKGWYKFDRNGSLVSASGVKVLPTTVNDLTDPYRLQYLKAAPTVESIRNYETGLTLCSGSNVVEVGSGIVIREKANPYFWEGANRAYINSGNPNDTNPWETTRLTHKTKDILNTYRNRNVDGFSWERLYGTLAYGNAYLRSKANMYDPTAVYHVTYTMLNPTLSAPINGNVATNLRGTVSDLVQRSGDVERCLSVVENQKADRDAKPPDWIVATLLNGWEPAGINDPVVSYRVKKDILEINGLTRNGSVNVGTVLFVLPSQARPSRNQNLAVLTSTGSTYPAIRLFIDSTTGEVKIYSSGAGNVWLSLNGIKVYL